MSVCLDSNVLAVWLDSTAKVPSGTPDARSRIEAYIDQLAEKGGRALVPMPAFAEVLSRGGGDVQTLIERMTDVSAIALVPFGQREAIELAEMNRAALATGDKRRGVPDTWAKVKFDRQIIATAKAARVTALLTEDDGMQRTAELEGLRVLRTSDLPIVAKQDRLPFD